VARPALADYPDALCPEERSYIGAAVDKRRAEFATARRIARRALETLGFSAGSLAPGPDRAPCWPAGAVGSIAHTDDCCGVVVARATDDLSVGLDIENLTRIEPAVLERILTRREAAWLEDQPRASRQDLAVLFFSAKEAFYKCQYPLSRGFLDFLEVEVEVDLEQRQFEAQVTRPDWPALVSRLSGRFAFHGEKVLCGVELRA